MPSKRVRRIMRSAVGVAAGCVFALTVSQAWAGDDGEAPIWVGVENVFGPYLGFDKDKDPAIDYRDHGRLVLPPKIGLPEPAAAPGVGSADWPVDPDVQKVKKAKQEDKTSLKNQPGRYKAPLVTPGSVVTMRANAGEGDGEAPPCPKDAKLGTCQHTQDPSYGHPKPNFNPLTWVGLQKKDPVVLGPEPDRDWLTDPPKGMRAPVEGSGAKIDN
jgi:hypothetical protein